MDLKKFKDGFRKAVKSLMEGEDGTYFWRLESTDKNDYAVVLGWTEETPDEVEETTPFYHDGYQLCAKIAYQPKSSIMQCDFDVDWIKPFDKEEGEVMETDYYINSEDDIEKAINELLEMWTENKQEYFEME